MNKFMTRAVTALFFVVVMIGMSSFKIGYFILFGLISCFNCCCCSSASSVILSEIGSISSVIFCDRVSMIQPVGLLAWSYFVGAMGKSQFL